MYCSECGMPRGVGKANTWKSSGVIVSNYETDLRGIFYDTRELENLFTSLSTQMDYDVTRLVIEGKRKDSKHYTRGLLKSIKESGAELPGPEEFFRIMAANYPVPGFGKVTILSYSDNEGIVLEMEDTYHAAMAQGQAAGVFEAVLDRRGYVSWEGDERSGRVTITVMEDDPELEKRIESEVEYSVSLSESGDREYELCSRCSAPMELSREFDWDVDKATINERRSGRRFIFDNTRGMTAVMQVLVEELGEDVEQLLLEISRAHARDYYDLLQPGLDAKSEFSRLSLWGWGLPWKLRSSNGGLELQVINPFYEPVMTGRVWGLLEAVDGRKLELRGRDLKDNIAYLELAAA
ncbi:MAG: hypothetical protein JW854_09110 [Actinobacteria bacterium]|nr:hypothetical protein [Actinomycetota bacterium]